MLTVFGTTYTYTSNYGSCLQAYALQKAVEKIKVREENCKYYLIPISAAPGYPKTYGKGIKQKIKFTINKQTRKKFTEFERKNMHYATVKSIDRFVEYNVEADAFVCGSDMIWNPKYNHEVTAYYLDFAQKYSFSYAASFGQSDIDVSKYKWIGQCLSKLHAISVREAQSAAIARKYTDTNIEITVDPVLLVNKDEWSKVASSDNIFGDYIFVYSVNTTRLLKNFVRKLKQQTGLKVIVSGGNSGAVLKWGMSKVFTPEQWLQLIRDAKYVITDSFHGTAFSVIFQKNLFTITDGDPQKGFNMRMSDFLGGIGLQDRIFSNVPSYIDCNEIDYTSVNGLLNKQIEFSLNYLQNNLEAAYKEKLELKANKET